jgi:hypothetical protein
MRAMAHKQTDTRSHDRDRDEERPTREGDVLGISDADRNARIPQHVKPGGTHPEGIEVRRHATGIGDLSQNPGATGIDMGGGGEGTGIASRSSRPKSAEPDDNE